MIYILEYNKFKKWNKSLDSLIKTYDVSSINEEDNLKRLLERGKDIFIFINPYVSELNSLIELSWDLDEQTALNRFYTLKEEI